MGKYVCSKHGINSRQVGGELNSVSEREQLWTRTLVSTFAVQVKELVANQI